jgi:Na+-transporting NADH:ubiquinone oxidoreductase subunit C
VQGNKKAFIFAVVMCLIVSAVLSTIANLLRPIQEENIRLDKQKNIIKALKVLPEGVTDVKEFYSTIEDSSIDILYKNNISSIVIDTSGKLIEGKSAEDILEKEKHLKPLYLLQKAGQISAYCLPIKGKGLWSTLHGFMAIEADLNTVKGLTFYAHGETPGLGAEIEKDWFQDNFVGKKILNAQGELVAVGVKKGKIVESIPFEKDHMVDGMSGATITGNGVDALIKKDLGLYNKYFSQIRGTI